MACLLLNLEVEELQSNVGEKGRKSLNSCRLRLALTCIGGVGK